MLISELFIFISENNANLSLLERRKLLDILLLFENNQLLPSKQVPLVHPFHTGPREGLRYKCTKAVSLPRLCICVSWRPRVLRKLPLRLVLIFLPPFYGSLDTVHAFMHHYFVLSTCILQWESLVF